MIPVMPAATEGTAGPSGSGSSRRIAVTVSIALPRRNGCDPVSIS